MERLKNPLEIFRAAGLPNEFLPIDYKKKDILFWHVPALLEENKNNYPTYYVTTKEEGSKNIHEFYENRCDAMTKYIEKNDIKVRMIQKSKNQRWREDGSITGEELRDFYEKYQCLLESSSMGRIGCHLSGLYVDFQKLEDIFDLSFKEANRVLDNNLSLANLALIYSAYTENLENSDVSNKAKELYKKAFNFVNNNPRAHLKPLFFNGKDIVEDNPKNSKQQISLQEYFVNQFVDIKKGKRNELDVQPVFEKQQKSVVRAMQNEIIFG